MEYVKKISGYMFFQRSLCYRAPYEDDLKMGFFSRKQKLTSKEFAQGLVFSANKILLDSHELFKKIIKINLLGEEEISNDEYKRREWEIFFFTITSIIMALEGKINIDSKNQLRNQRILDDFIEELTGNYLNTIAGSAKHALPINFKNDFSEKIWQRYKTYKNSWIEKEPGPVWHLSKCFLSIIWFADLIDEDFDFLKQYPVPFPLDDMMFVSKFFMNTIKFVNDTFNQFKISA